MEAGVEDLDQRPEDPENQEWRPLIHLDIKPMNGKYIDSIPRTTESKILLVHR